MQYKEKELVISFKLNEPNPLVGIKSIPESQSSIFIPIPTGNYYAIQLIAIKDPKKDKSYIARIFSLDNLEFNLLDSRAEGIFRVYYLGRFVQQKDADEKLKSLVSRKNCEDCKNDKIRVITFEKLKDGGHRPVK